LSHGKELLLCAPKPPTEESSEVEKWYYEFFLEFPFSSGENLKLQVRFDDEPGLSKQLFRHGLMVLLHNHASVEEIEDYLAQQAKFILWMRADNHQLYQTKGDGLCMPRTMFQAFRCAQLTPQVRSKSSFQQFDVRLDKKSDRDEFLDYLQKLLHGYEQSLPGSIINHIKLDAQDRTNIIDRLRNAIQQLRGWDWKNQAHDFGLDRQHWLSWEMARNLKFIPEHLLLHVCSSYFGHLNGHLTGDGKTSTDHNFLSLTFASHNPQPWSTATSFYGLEEIYEVLTNNNMFRFSERGKHFCPLQSLQVQQKMALTWVTECKTAVNEYASALWNYNQQSPAPLLQSKIKPPATAPIDSFVPPLDSDLVLQLRQQVEELQARLARRSGAAATPALDSNIERLQQVEAENNKLKQEMSALKKKKEETVASLKKKWQREWEEKEKMWLEERRVLEEKLKMSNALQ